MLDARGLVGSEPASKMCSVGTEYSAAATSLTNRYRQLFPLGGTSALCHKEVGWLDVTVHNALGLLGIECVCDLDGSPGGARPG